jgi:hypothetical protein
LWNAYAAPLEVGTTSSPAILANFHQTAANWAPTHPGRENAAARAVLSDPLDLLGYLLNDHGNACRMIALYGEDLRYCHAFKKWLVWDGMRWSVDDTGQACRLAKQTVLEFSETGD